MKCLVQSFNKYEGIICCESKADCENPSYPFERDRQERQEDTEDRMEG
jgi:hypothetical protein